VSSAPGSRRPGVVAPASLDQEQDDDRGQDEVADLPERHVDVEGHVALREEVHDGRQDVGRGVPDGAEDHECGHQRAVEPAGDPQDGVAEEAGLDGVGGLTHDGTPVGIGDDGLAVCDGLGRVDEPLLVPLERLVPEGEAHGLVDALVVDVVGYRSSDAGRQVEVPVAVAHTPGADFRVDDVVMTVALGGVLGHGLPSLLPFGGRGG